ncbi:MAG: GNAT family N-acetyltransferase [Chloroflexi bacterium]|nr:GNAT family N-acetyltransferase [Chloroflexota bacterium]
MALSEVVEVSDEIIAACWRLVPQLSSSNPPPSPEEVAEIVRSPATILFIARDPELENQIVGMLTLVIFRIPTGQHAWIEDVVVDERARRKGIGEALTRAAIERARAAGAATVDLTSRPSREAANRLYQRLGFVKRDTNVYRYTL